jgi:hypothetical protein
MKNRMLLIVAVVLFFVSGCSKGCDEETPTEPKQPSSLYRKQNKGFS